MKKNGYFQLIRNEKGLSIRIFPPEEGGDCVAYNEIEKYLEKNHVTEIDVSALNQAVISANTEVKQVVLTLNKGYPINETFAIRYEENNLRAIVRFYSESNDGKKVEKPEILGDLANLGIKFGLKEEEIDRFLKERRYCTDYVIAEGEKPRHGSDAQIHYLFNTDRKAKPRRKEDGSVDFHQLDNISHIRKGEVLAELIPADLGEKGMDVFGNPIQPRKVERKSLKHGKNVIVSEDGLQMISDVDGHAILEGDKVFVSNVYEVAADVDNSTGDITYEGSVVVKGSVRTGFKIKAAGDVEVFGAVEGAEIVAGGQIVLHHGIQGMSKGILVAKGNIVAKFIESARVHSQGYIEADTIIQSQVAAKGDINVQGVKGNIIGGCVRSTTRVTAKTIGSSMGITTMIMVGTEPSVQEKMINLKASLEEKNTAFKKLSQLADLFQKKAESGQLPKDKLAMYKKTLEDMSEARQNMINIQVEMEGLEAQLKANSEATIAVSRDMYAGTKLTIGDEVKIINDTVCHCRFKIREGEIRSLPL